MDEQKLVFAIALASMPIAFAEAKPFDSLELNPVNPEVVESSNLLESKASNEFSFSKPTNIRSSAECNVFDDHRSVACLGPETTYQPNNKYEKWVQTAAIYSTRFVPMLNMGSSFSDYSDVIEEDGKAFVIGGINSSSNSYMNDQIQKIPFFAQSSISINAGSSDKSISVSVDSLMKLKQIEDKGGDLKTLFFSQAKYTGSGEMDGSTINFGLGVRNRPNDFSMLGGNMFWDHRRMNSSRALHNRIGLGSEYLWKDFEVRNNWYIATMGKRDVSIDGIDYTERVVPGWDVEVGYRLPDYPELGVFFRGFNWDYHDTQDNNGAQASLNWQATSHVNLEAWISNEISAIDIRSNSALPGLDEYFVGINFKITNQPVKFEVNNYKKNIITQMTQPVRRNYEVLIERSTGEFSNRAKGS